MEPMETPGLRAAANNPEQLRPNHTLAHGVSNSVHEMYIAANRTRVPQTARGGCGAPQEPHFEEAAPVLPPDWPGLPCSGRGKRMQSKPRLMLRPFRLFPFHSLHAKPEPEPAMNTTCPPPPGAPRDSALTRTSAPSKNNSVLT